MVRIELYGIPRSRAGRRHVDVDAQNLGDAVRKLEHLCPSLRPDVIVDGSLTLHYVAAVNGGEITRDPATPLRHGDTLVVLGAQAGG